ncbi:SubName: Full=Uncharacterized protein {ECO:0000313/EMBL:CCA76649.1} [Serendipita indica DSM 11827]|nr:SubName: Full=Uncharacterized protein {ECO:0000313/EMBL:CCA76649.1} [Serendipita indica DSM 11827]
MESFVLFLSYERIVKYTAVSATSVFIYDYILTLPLEISLIWTRWGGWLGKFVFFYVRTTGIGSPPDLTTGGHKSHRSHSRIYTLPLDDRMCTLYQKTRWIIVFMTIFYFVSAVGQIIAGILAMRILIPLTGSIDGHCALTGETPRNVDKIIAGSYLSMMPCETVILAATIGHSIWARRLQLLGNASSTLPILTRLYRDGVLYFGLALALRLCGALVWLVAPANLKLSADYCAFASLSREAEALVPDYSPPPQLLLRPLPYPKYRIAIWDNQYTSQLPDPWRN